jgi:hypothetical protein
VIKSTSTFCFPYFSLPHCRNWLKESYGGDTCYVWEIRNITFGKEEDNEDIEESKNKLEPNLRKFNNLKH